MAAVGISLHLDGGFGNWTLFDNPKKKDKISKFTPLHPSPSRGRRGGEEKSYKSGRKFH
jgi:hypothetical protein